MIAMSGHPASFNDPRTLKLRALTESAVPKPVANLARMLGRAVRAEGTSSFEYDRESLVGPSNEGKRSCRRGKRAGRKRHKFDTKCRAPT